MQRSQKKQNKKQESSTMEIIFELLQKLDAGQKEIKKDLKEMRDDIKKEIAGLRDDLKNVKDFAEDNRERVEELERDLKGSRGGQKNLEIGALNLQLEGKEVLILKQIPRKIRETRKKYYFLTKKLYLKGIMFGWTLPVFWEGRRSRIETIIQAQAFLKDYEAFLEPKEMEEMGETRVDQRKEGGVEAGTAPGVGGGAEVPLLARLGPRKDPG